MLGNKTDESSCLKWWELASKQVKFIRCHVVIHVTEKRETGKGAGRVGLEAGMLFKKKPRELLIEVTFEQRSAENESHSHK